MALCDQGQLPPSERARQKERERHLSVVKGYKAISKAFRVQLTTLSTNSNTMEQW